MIPLSAVSPVSSCDREPIHLSGAIQQHGIMLVLDRQTHVVVGEAGDIPLYLGYSTAIGSRVSDFFKEPLLIALRAVAQAEPALLGLFEGPTHRLNALAFISGDYIVVEMDYAGDLVIDPVTFLSALDAAANQLEASNSMRSLCDVAAAIFRDLTKYDRVMVYRFLDDEAGTVVGESLVEGAYSYMNHHFPASDIPKQARALYVRNRSRVIPDVAYSAQPIHSDRDLAGLDLSESGLRSVSPVHIEYLKNMKVGASASFSIIKDGELWGLVACHNLTPKHMPLVLRVAGQALANSLARQIRAKEDAEMNRERIRLRSQEDLIMQTLGDHLSLEQFFASSGELLANLMHADGFAAIQGKDLFCWGRTPDAIDVREIAEFVRIPASHTVFSTNSLSRRMPGATDFADKASGLMAVTMSTEVPTILLWFRAEHVELVKWAGNPHKGVPLDPNQVLAPRSSFEAWTESVRQKARLWSYGQIESAGRIVRIILEHRNIQRVRELNRELTTSLRENENLLEQKDYLLREGNHRVQNSLQLVASFLRLQARSSTDEGLRESLGEAQKRLNAVALVHRRLYQDASVEIVDLSRYLENLISDLTDSMDVVWREHLTLDLAPVLITTDKAVNIGLILTELVINVQKYAYGGAPGPLSVKLEEYRGYLRLVVSDVGGGKEVGEVTGSGFGSRLMSALMERMHGYLSEENNNPGLKVTLTAPIRTET